MIYINRERSLKSEEWNEILSVLGLCKRLEDAKSVVIKPNFAAGSYVDPLKHCVVDKILLSSVINCIAKTNSRAVIYIAESDSTGNGFAYLKFQHLGIPDTLDVTNDVLDRVRCLDLTRDRLKIIKEEKMKYFSSDGNSLCLSETLCSADFVISLCNLKAHSVTGYTGACKNLFGCLPDFDKSHYHPYIHRVIHDLALVISPSLSIVDGFYAMEGNGPVHGSDKDAGFRIFSDSAVEADLYGSKSIGLNPNQVDHIKFLTKTLEIKENVIPAETVQFKRPVFFLRFMNIVGIRIQGFGQLVAALGHRVHTCYNFLSLCVALFRPVLVKMFGIEKLKNFKKRILK